MSELQIDTILSGDEEAVIALWLTSGVSRPWNDPRSDIKFVRDRSHSEILVGKHEGRIVSSVMVGEDGHRGWMYYLCVAPEYRGNGFGKLILEAAERWLGDRGVSKINLLVRSENSSAKAFYERLGYEMSDVVCLQKQI